ncbi:MAG TPA: cellulase family glycosylhydrolase, partial [Gaiellaceae bacterium]|nr:cellulase family glycosylhydrolase [Gaiellaceae bacterium]
TPDQAGVMITQHRGASALALLSAALVALAAAPAAPAAQVGVVADVTWGQPREDVDRELELLRKAGVRWIRANVNWAGLEPDAKGDLNEWLLAEYDYAVERALASGFEVLMPIADGVPYWASADPAKRVDDAGARRWEVTYRPARAADFGDVVRFVVARYAPKGVRVFQIWNEPNHPRFWPSGPNAAEYVPLLRAGYEAAKEADPGATVLLGGLSKSDFYYLEDVYRLGGGAYFDAVAVQPYTYGVDPTASWKGVHDWEDPDRISVNAFPAIREIRRSMVAFGDAHKQVWLTEFGYSTTTKDGGVSPARQAAFLTKAYRYVERLPWVEALFWYAARNSPFHGDRDEYEARFGLLTSDFEPKPSYAALRAYALGPAAGKVELRRASQRLVRRGGRAFARVGLRGSVAVGSGLVSRSAGVLAAERRRVVVQRLRGGEWVAVDRVRTDSLGAFRANVLARGPSTSFRAVVRHADLSVRSRVVRVRLRRP